MKTFRIIIATLSLLYAIPMCVMMVGISAMDFLSGGSLKNLMIGIPFVSCLIIYGLFIKDTFTTKG